MRKLLVFCLLLLFVVGCQNSAENDPTPPPEQTTENTDSGKMASGVVISEILTGVEGGNTTEFIELYNASQEIVDLRGWTLTYNSRGEGEDVVLYRWSLPTLIPPFGHYLLAHEGIDVGAEPDATFEAGLSGTKGGLLLTARGGDLIDSVGWGDDPAGFAVGNPAPNPERGTTLERLPGGEAGNGVNSADNAADFQINPAPSPQNSGDVPTPLPAERITIQLTVPETVEPGSQFTYQVAINSNVSAEINDVLVRVPLDDRFEVVSLPDGAALEKGSAEWTITIPPNETLQYDITLASPFTYFDTAVAGYYADADGYIAAFGKPQPIGVAGGAIPVQTARSLEGATVSVEGIAVMYTDGFFAGSTGTKFYIEDESGGIQVYVPGGLGEVDVQVGDRVKVTGEIELYRNSLEIIPEVAQIEIVESSVADPQPAPISIVQNETDDAILGTLTTFEGKILSIVDGNFDYQIEVADNFGETTTVLIEKDTGVTAEPLDVGESYRFVGISEFYSGLRQLKPRFQDDISLVFPPELRVETTMPATMLLDENATILINVTNHAPEPMTDVVVTVAGDYPQDYAVGTLAGGESAEFEIPISSANEDAWIYFGGVTAVSAEQPAEQAATFPEKYIFIGNSVPIWAIQGTGDRSPYVRETIPTRGIVLHTLASPSGFWIQTDRPDENPASSDGIFVLTEGFVAEVAAGDVVELTGLVREIAGQTTLQTQSDQIAVVTQVELPAPVVLDPPQETAAGLAYFEALEGMLVQVADTAIAIGPTTKYGETPFVLEKWGVDEVARTDERGYVIIIDDNSDAGFEDRREQDLTVAKGDLLDGTVGVLAYTFENYKINPITPLAIQPSSSELPAYDFADDQLSFATFNVENLFDRFDPHPTGTYQPGKDEYETKLTKIANAIIRMDAPAVVGLQEVENIGVLEDLVAVGLLADFAYTPYLIEGEDGRGIDVAYLVREGLVMVNDVSSHPAPEGLTSRPPLVLNTTIEGQTVYFLNNHFSSLAAGEEATEPRRTAQAAWNVELIDGFRSADPSAQFVMMGDLNSFYQTLPINTLQDAGLRHVYEVVPSDHPLPYTYIFEGATQTLDHILVSDGLFEALVDVVALHIGADYPITDFSDVSAERVSDHDPLIAVFELNK